MKSVFFGALLFTAVSANAFEINVYETIGAVKNTPTNLYSVCHSKGYNAEKSVILRTFEGREDKPFMAITALHPNGEVAKQEVIKANESFEVLHLVECTL